ncbi:hypothetical protein Nepgr_031312 [Nepenthes gracilis]|uniref:Uncharacterized protein n=1 Tax=Nepenthes gracilis TaxID=150966 RepID=A0AAD3THV9_NEPGR|nr:hypothetical protein Nepgr_031312 [Nepenthes gracilis]
MSMNTGLHWTDGWRSDAMPGVGNFGLHSEESIFRDCFGRSAHHRSELMPECAGMCMNWSAQSEEVLGTEWCKTGVENSECICGVIF